MKKSTWLLSPAVLLFSLNLFSQSASSYALQDRTNGLIAFGIDSVLIYAPCDHFPHTPTGTTAEMDRCYIVWRRNDSSFIKRYIQYLDPGSASPYVMKSDSLSCDNQSMRFFTGCYDSLAVEDISPFIYKKGTTTGNAYYNIERGNRACTDYIVFLVKGAWLEKRIAIEALYSQEINGLQNLNYTTNQRTKLARLHQLLTSEINNLEKKKAFDKNETATSLNIYIRK